jgi:hypothetical protein
LAGAHRRISADFSKTAQISSNNMENLYTVTYGASMKKSAQTTPSMDGVSSFFYGFEVDVKF